MTEHNCDDHGGMFEVPGDALRDLKNRADRAVNKLAEVRSAPRSYHEWRTNPYHGNKLMRGCRYCPSSIEAEQPLETLQHHKLCPLSFSDL